MGTYLLATLIDDINTTIGAASSLQVNQSYDDITEGIPEFPLLQVYPEENPGTELTDTDRVTLGMSTERHSVKEYLIHADLYARPRSFIAEDMKQLVETIDEIEQILDTQDYPDIFGNDNVISFSWSWRRMIFQTADQKYMGARFFLRVEMGTEAT